MLALTLLLAATVQSSAPSTADLQKIITDRIDSERRGVGIVVGVVDESGRRIVSHGSLDTKSKRPVSGDTIFEIGSVSKVFTSLLLADAVTRGEVALTDPIAKYLPAEVNVPERGGKRITLQDLATHTSGLPRLPSNMNPKDPANPYADYTVEQLYAFLSSYQLTRDIGSKYEYSNLGAGLLGHILARRAGTTYEELLKTRITGPLGMKDTFIAIPASAKARFATGHDISLEPVPYWDLPTLAGAGAIHSTANDLVTLVAAAAGLVDSPLKKAMALMLTVHRPADSSNEVALAWHLRNGTVWHNGGTAGFRSFIGFDPVKKIGVVALSNVSTAAGVDDIGRYVLDPSQTLTKAQAEVKVAGDALEKYIGRYELAPSFNITITREGDHLFAQATGQPRFEIYPQSESKFFYKVVDAQITFTADALTLHQNGRDLPGRRVSKEAPPAREEITLAPEVLDRYVGRYELNPSFIITITREGTHLYAQATAQPRFEIFPETEHDFFVKVVDAQITFEDGRLVLHQNGMNQPAKKIQ